MRLLKPPFVCHWQDLCESSTDNVFVLHVWLRSCKLMSNGDRVRPDLYKQHREHSGTHVRPVFPNTMHRLDSGHAWQVEASPHALQVFVAESDRCVGFEDPQGALSPSDVPPPSVKSDLGHRKRPAGVALSGTIADISPNP